MSAVSASSNCCLYAIAQHRPDKARRVSLYILGVVDSLLKCRESNTDALSTRPRMHLCESSPTSCLAYLRKNRGIAFQGAAFQSWLGLIEGLLRASLAC